MTYIALDIADLAIGAILIVVNAGLSLWLGLGLTRQYLIAAARMVVQLALLGLVLKILFALVSPLFTGLAATVMIGFAGYEILARQERRLAGWWGYGLGTSCMLFAAGIVTLFALTAQIQADPWYHPRYALPLLGMILGNTMTGISLGLNNFAVTASRERAAVEAQLALGETRQIAFGPILRRATRTGLIPIINAMSAAGLVSLPGMMTGQILAGADPVDAIKYQILIMFLISGGTALGVVFAVQAAAARLSDSRHRLRLDRLGPGAGG